MDRDQLPLDRRLRQEILFARERVYRFAAPTPIERLVLPGNEPGPEIWVKREDLSPVKSYKWRGACNCMAQLTPDQRERGVVTASAGNHAQGVALAAKTLGIQARIHMPRSTPKVKQNAVRQHGGDFVEIVLTGDGRAVTGCWMTGPDLRPPVLDGLAPDPDGSLDEACRQLDEYFAGDRRAFELPLAPHGTDFQLRVWAQLRTIPYGTTCTYADVARGIGATNGFRAVGLANGRNPISIIVPCHRVIGADGSLTGYGGGIERKAFLLDLEAGGLPFR